ncbi:MAG: RecX family transcriptional regulator [bacterium]|nr:RecX family transcriptional regulator [bacterium]
MEKHRPPPERSGVEGRPSRRRRRNAQPLDADWLEDEAIRYVAQWETTRLGVRDVLVRRLRKRCERSGEDPETLLGAIPEVIDRLVERGYIDDRRFAEQWIERSRRLGRSGARIRAQLEAKGVDPSLLGEVEARAEEEHSAQHSSEDPAETPIDEEFRAAWRTASRRGLGPFCPDASERADRRQRHLAVLARQGFSRDVAHRVIDALVPPEKDGDGAGR